MFDCHGAYVLQSPSNIWWHEARLVHAVHAPRNTTAGPSSNASGAKARRASQLWVRLFSQWEIHGLGNKYIYNIYIYIYELFFYFFKGFLRHMQIISSCYFPEQKLFVTSLNGISTQLKCHFFLVQKGPFFAGWWFGTFFSIYWDNDPNWLIFFTGVGIPPTSLSRGSPFTASSFTALPEGPFIYFWDDRDGESWPLVPGFSADGQNVRSSRYKNHLCCHVTMVH